MEEAPPHRPSILKRLSDAWATVRMFILLLLGVIGASLALSIPVFQGGTAFQLEVNQVSQQDILAPEDREFTSEVLTEQARQAAAEAIPDLYRSPDQSIARRQIERLNKSLDYIEIVRADEFATPEQQRADLAELTYLDMDREFAQALLDLTDPRWQVVRSEAGSVLEQVMRNVIREDREGEARRSVPTLVSISLPESQADLVVRMTNAFVAPNSLFDSEATEEARLNARQGVAPISNSYFTGETIVSRGEVVTPLALEALQTYGLLTPPDQGQQIALRFLLVTVLASILALFAYRVHLDEIRSFRMSSSLVILIVLATLGMAFMIPERAVLPYLFPAATVPILMAVLLGPGFGVLSALVCGALAGYLGARGLELSLYVALSGGMGALFIGRAERLGTFVWAGLAASLAAVAMIVIFRFPDPATDTLGKATLLGVALINGLFSASLAFGVLLLIGNLLGFTTNLQLIELSRPDHPLLQHLLVNAPGSYQHSLQVANLAEQAARAIDANTLLTRVGALYHDVGKSLRPHFFIENQVPGQNIHDQLDPMTSADMILAHVRDGIDLARKYRLPPDVAAFIPEHHGTMVTSYQYQQAMALMEGQVEQVDIEDFTYPGPRPRSRETALLMLADGVEAQARAEKPESEEAIAILVRGIIEGRLSSGQLDHTDLTLRDLDTVRRSFSATLKSIYHPRIRYPRALPQGIDSQATQPRTISSQAKGS